MNNSILYTITVLIWGSTWLAIEYQLGVVEPEVSIAYRYAAAALVLFAWCWFRGLPLRFGAKDHAYFVLLGLLLFCLNYIFAYRAQVHITSALAAIAFSTMLWMNIILSRIIFGTRVTLNVLAGALLGVEDVEVAAGFHKLMAFLGTDPDDMPALLAATHPTRYICSSSNPLHPVFSACILDFGYNLQCSGFTS